MTIGGKTSELQEIQRTVRALIGWFDPRQVDLLFAGAELADYQRRAEAAREAVAHRPADTDQSGLSSDAPASLNDHVTALAATPLGQAIFSAGAAVRIVDLSKVFAAQPFVFSGDASKRVEQIDASNLGSIAAVTLPLPEPVQLPGQYDFARRAYIFSSANPNLKVLGNCNVTVEGHHVFGFAIGVGTSLVSVGGYQGRYFLRDGYHRCYGLLARGITHVPALVQEFAAFEHLGLPQGMLPQEAYLGSRPPRLSDYLDNNVAIEATRPATRKVVIIQSIELDVLR